MSPCRGIPCPECGITLPTGDRSFYTHKCSDIPPYDKDMLKDLETTKHPLVLLKTAQLKVMAYTSLKDIKINSNRLVHNVTRSKYILIVY